MYFKFVILFIALTFGHARIAYKLFVRFPEVEREKVVKAVLDCGPVYNIEPSVAFEEIKEGKYEETKEYQEFIHCVFEKSDHLRDDAGHIDTEKVSPFFPEEFNARDTIYGCSQEEGKNAIETTFLFYKCFQDKSDVRVHFLL